MFLSLSCRDCEQDKCVFSPIGKWIKGKEGCTREVSEETAARFNHYMNEVIPFWKTYSVDFVRQSYKEIITFLFNEIYNAPIGQKLNAEGKVSLKK